MVAKKKIVEIKTAIIKKTYAYEYENSREFEVVYLTNIYYNINWFAINRKFISIFFKIDEKINSINKSSVKREELKHKIISLLNFIWVKYKTAWNFYINRGVV